MFAGARIGDGRSRQRQRGAASGSCGARARSLGVCSARAFGSPPRPALLRSASRDGMALSCSQT
jgi:hypothetical protein